MQTSGSRYESF
uniref:Uncharacterized protein n=1 Tax=Anguilla anguilla TaxID=7936 RepID=A0A0E9Q0Q2_ANGAN